MLAPPPRRVCNVGCALTRPVPADVRVPPELLRGSNYTAGGEPARTRYVVRMTDGQRDWEIQLPEIATAYEVKVPLSGKPASRLAVDMATMTAADREILQEREAAARAESGEPRAAPAKDDVGRSRRAASGRRRATTATRSRAKAPGAQAGRRQAARRRRRATC